MLVSVATPGACHDPHRILGIVRFRSAGMKRVDAVGLLVLAALWGASYLFIRVGAPEFGALAFAGLRAALAAAFLLPLLVQRDGLAALRQHWKPIALVGLANSALPFVLFGYAALTLTAGMSAIFTAATPLCAALIGVCWLGEALGLRRAMGLGIGFTGVLWLVWDRARVAPDADAAAVGLAIAACLAATMLYASSAHYTKRRLADVPPLAVAAGSQLVSALVLAPMVVWRWPAATPSAPAWAALAALALVCTAAAYVLFFRLIARLGASRTTAVLFMIPAFGMLWGTTLLGETATPSMLGACAVILFGTAWGTGNAAAGRKPLRA